MILLLLSYHKVDSIYSQWIYAMEFQQTDFILLCFTDWWKQADSIVVY